MFRLQPYCIIIFRLRVSTVHNSIDIGTQQHGIINTTYSLFLVSKFKAHIEGSVQDCGISSALVQSCTRHRHDDWAFRITERNWRTPSSMEFHGIPWNCWVSEIGAPQVPWSSMEFHGTARVIKIGALKVPWNSMELLVSSKSAHLKFHGIPWNCSCHRNWRTPSCMYFHEFHGTARVIEIGALQVPWNCWCQFHGIPWNLLFVI